MKKSIYLTIGSVLFTSGVVAAGVLLPSITSISSSFAFNLYNFSSSSDATLYFNENNFQAINENYKNLIIGNSNINNGTYILYIGSQAYSTNNSFLYGSQSEVNSTVSEVNQQPELLGDFGVGLKFFEKLENQPKVLVLQDQLTYADYQDKEEYENLVKEYKNIDISSGEYKPDSDEVKKKNWADNIAPSFNSAPCATYTTWDGKTEYFRKTNKFPIFFNEVVSFVKANFNNLTDLSSSNGILIGYKNGKICSDFSGSFTSSSDSTEEDTGTQSLFFQSFSTKQQTTNSFTNWLTENYGLKE